MSKANHLAFWDQEDVNNPLLMDIKVVDDVEKHSKHAVELSGGNVGFHYVPINAAYNAQELVTRLYNLVNAEDEQAVIFYKNEARETLKKVMP